jgi:hydrogenase maturation protease
MPLERSSMNVSASPLILGIGNPLRSDDGLGRAVAQQLAQAGDLECSVQVVHQLMPELAQDMAAARLVVMIDASRAGEPGEMRVRPLSPSLQPAGTIGAHHATPEELAALTAAIYGHCPPVVVITMTGADFSLGERLSSIVEQKIALVSAAVRQICASFRARL